MQALRLTEKYRPRTLSDVVGQAKVCQIAQRYIDGNAVGGRAFWISGVSGSGKTTIARILAAHVADDFFTTEVVGRDVNAEFLEALARDAKMYAFGRGGRAWIVNEAHGLSKAAIERLLDILESLPSHVTVIFTTTRDGQEKLFEAHDDAGPLLSRCIPLRLTNQGLAAAAADRLVQIARAENLGEPTADAAVKLMRRVENNLRAAIQAVEAGEFIAA